MSDKTPVTLDDIEPNISYELTDELDALFRKADCIPHCHFCLKFPIGGNDLRREASIKVGERFKLLLYGAKDIMVCGHDHRERAISAENGPIISERVMYSRIVSFGKKKSGKGFCRPSRTLEVDHDTVVKIARRAFDQGTSYEATGKFSPEFENCKVGRDLRALDPESVTSVPQEVNEK